MEEPEIVNKVAQSGLINLNLEEIYPKGNRVIYDLKQNLWQEIALKEKDFRTFIKEHDWSVYKGKYVGVTCSADAIVPVWAYMLLTTALQPHAELIVFGDEEDLEKEICSNFIQNMDLEPYKDQRVIVKGCAAIPNQELAMVELTKKLMPVTKSLMFGEACSTVPLHKRKA